jgi:hypothetical protein
VKTAFLGPTALFPHYKAGTIKLLAHTGSKRSPILPEIPTLDESGYKVVLDAWYAAFVPSGTPAGIVAKLNSEMNQALKDPKLLETFKAGAVEPIGGTPRRSARSPKPIGEIRAAGERAQHQDELADHLSVLPGSATPARSGRFRLNNTRSHHMSAYRQEGTPVADEPNKMRPNPGAAGQDGKKAMAEYEASAAATGQDRETASPSWPRKQPSWRRQAAREDQGQGRGKAGANRQDEEGARRQACGLARRPGRQRRNT